MPCCARVPSRRAQLDAKRQALGEERFRRSKYELAAKLIAGTVQGKEYSDFLTTMCYEHILSTTVRRAKI